MRNWFPCPACPWPRRLLLAAPFASLSLIGCACDDWYPDTYTTAADTEALLHIDAPECDVKSLKHLSTAAAPLVERADPRLLEAARLEAERDCYKAAETRSRKRLEALKRTS